MKSKDIRSAYLEFFQGHGHRVVPSSTLVPADDPTLLFTNAGMVQFKRVFTGEERREYRRATTSQKCVRAGGKHNDLENVGYTARHHTFFEMLGNFSFGDYFKADAIAFAWELLTRKFGLPKDRLYATVYKDDDEAFALWQKVAGLPADRIYRLGEKDNFWSMGETGPCGPCSEIHIDQGPHIGCGRPDCAPGCDCDRFLEIWNLVFMQFERFADGAMKPLPKPSIDTGLGLERISAVCQGVSSNFETDLFTPLIAKVAGLTHIPYEFGRELRPGDDNFETNVSTRVLADHARAVTFLINDGVRPENLGRGYVLRRILRRAARHGRKLGLGQPFLAQLADTVIDEMGGAYPDLVKNAAYIKTTVTAEEERFGETLDTGLALLSEAMESVRKKGGQTIDGATAFKLYDTFGFPFDLVGDAAREKGLSVDEAGFNAEMQKQRERSKKTWRGGDDNSTAVTEAVNTLTAQGFTTRFTGYDGLALSGQKPALLLANGQVADEAGAGDDVILAFAQTPFYAFSGGQAGDGGAITFPHGQVTVADVTKAPGTNVFLHAGRVTAGHIAAGEAADLAVDGGRRAATAANHTATHLLHKALRAVLGDHVRQAGSLVTADRLRFDFTHHSAVGPEDMARIEAMVNEAARADYEVTTQVMGHDEALKTGAMALFEEKYGEKVRVVSVGGGQGGPFSQELCGGTHVGRTGRIGAFVVVSEGSVAAGVRRLECLTGRAAVEHIQGQRAQLHAIAAALRCQPGEVPERLAKLQAKVKELEKAGGPAADMDLDGLTARAEAVGGRKILAAQVALADPKAMRELGDKLRDRLGADSALALADDKGHLLVMVGKGAKNLHAGKIIGQMAAAMGGKGGGRPDMAQAGGDPAQAAAALALFRKLAAE